MFRSMYHKRIYFSPQPVVAFEARVETSSCPTGKVVITFFGVFFFYIFAILYSFIPSFISTLMASQKTSSFAVHLLSDRDCLEGGDNTQNRGAPGYVGDQHTKRARVLFEVILQD